MKKIAEIDDIPAGKSKLIMVDDKPVAIFNINGKIFNVGSGNSISVNYIVKQLKGKKIFIPKRPGEPNKTFADIKKIKKYLKWTPKVNIDKGIKLLLKNIDDWKDAPVWTKNKIHIATKSWFKYLK